MGNLNNSEIIEGVTFDNTDPAISSFDCTPVSVSVGAIVTCSCSGADGGVGVFSTSYTATPSTSTAGTFTETCTVVDYAGNSVSSTTSYTVISGGSSPAVGGSSGPAWSMTYNIPENSFETGYSKAMKVKERMKFKIGEEYHQVGVKSITSSKVVVEIASDTITLELEIGEDAKVDLDADGNYDLYVILNGIENSKADITVKSLDEVVPEGVEGGVETSGDVVEDSNVDSDLESDDISEERGSWWIAIIVVLLIAAAGGSAWKKKQ